MALAQNVLKFKVKFHQFLHLADLFLVQFLCGFEVDQVVVVYVDNRLMYIAYKVGLPSCKGVDNDEKFLVINVPIALHCISVRERKVTGWSLSFSSFC